MRRTGATTGSDDSARSGNSGSRLSVLCLPHPKGRTAHCTAPGMHAGCYCTARRSGSGIRHAVHGRICRRVACGDIDERRTRRRAAMGGGRDCRKDESGAESSVIE